jgi:hypothetical protein
MRLPFVSRRYAEFLEETLKRVIAERDEQQRRADIALDQLAASRGFEPSTPSVRAEVLASKEIERYLVEQFEDPEASGMIEEIAKAVEGEPQKAN